MPAVPGFTTGGVVGPSVPVHAPLFPGDSTGAVLLRTRLTPYRIAPEHDHQQHRFEPVHDDSP